MTILVATDFSPEAVEAGRLAADFANAIGASLKLVHVLEHSTIYPLGRTSDHIDIEAARYERARKLLEHEAGTLLDASRVSTAVLRGDVVSALQREVLVHAPQLVVVGGCGPEGKSSYRNLAEECAQALSVAVLVVRPVSDRFRLALQNGRRPRVLVALDRTQASEPAIAWVRDLRAHLPCDIITVQYYWPAVEHERLGLPLSGSYFDGDPRVSAALEREVRARFSGLTGEGELTVRCEPRIGSTGENLVETSRSANADMIVIGSHRRQGLSRFVHGSVSREVLRYSDIPVVCVGAEPYRTAAARPIRHVLVATDLSDDGNAAVARAYDLVRDGGRVDIVHVVAGPMDGVSASATRSLVENNVDGIRARLRGLIPEEVDDVEIHTEVFVELGGPPAAKILQRSERSNVDVVVVGSHGKSALDRALLGSVATEIVNNATRPVLVVRRRPR